MDDPKSKSNSGTCLVSGITHIMNVAEEMKSPFKDMFITIQLPVKDTANSDMAKYFSKALEFFARVESCKGKILIHCDNGMSRAPAMAMAYLVAGPPKLSLADAFDYIRVRRPSILPNRVFLTQLAELEIEQGEGCSVLFHRDWSYYEFNVIKSTKPDFRESAGVYALVHQLYGGKEKKHKDDHH
jgi:protein-tyrosine phosphatase